MAISFRVHIVVYNGGLFGNIYLHLHTAMGLISSDKRILIKLEDISENRDNLDLQNKNTNTKQNKTEEQMFGLYKLV